MARIMYEHSGIGLAAPQVGLSESMIVVDVGSGLFKMINPRIVKKEGRQALEEGCLSVPGICIKVNRARRVRVKGQDEFGNPLTVDVESLLACVFQHEIDHLRGKMIIDYASFMERLQVSKKLKGLKKRSSHEAMCQPEQKSCQLHL